MFPREPEVYTPVLTRVGEPKSSSLVTPPTPPFTVGPLLLQERDRTFGRHGIKKENFYKNDTIFFIHCILNGKIGKISILSHHN